MKRVSQHKGQRGIVHLVFKANGSGDGRLGTWTELAAAIRARQSDPETVALIVYADDSEDIGTFGSQDTAACEALIALCEVVESSAKPVAVALRGNVDSRLVELGLAASYRVAEVATTVRMADVQVGLPPTPGTTRRLTSLVGAGCAIDILLACRAISSNEGLAIGLFDWVADHGDLGNRAEQWLVEAMAQGSGHRRSGGLEGQDVQSSLAAISGARDKFAKAFRGQLAPWTILDAMAAALGSGPDKAQALERESYLECLNSPQREGLGYAARAEAQVWNVPESREHSPRPLRAVGIIGGGTMGAGIAVAMLDAGLDVTMVERDPAALERGSGNVRKVYDRLVASGRMSQVHAAKVLGHFRGATSLDAISEADVVVEAVFEEMAVKKAVFGELDRLCKPGAVLATNTSFLDVEEIAASISRPQDVIGLHFFSPANIMKLLEIVVPRGVAGDVVATAYALARRLGKIPVRAGVCDGFIGNRILYVYREAASYMLEDGASPYEIDRALEGFGYAMGPYRTADLTGGDISWAARKRKAATRDPNARYVRIADLLCERGWFGQKTGRGFYAYPDGARSGSIDPDVLALIDAERRERGIVPRKFSAEEIVRRYLCALINEAAKVLEEGIALRPMDIDVTMLNGYGFPRWRGGPMKYADSIGLARILADIRAWEAQDPRFWRPAALLVDLAERGATFEELNTGADRA